MDTQSLAEIMERDIARLRAARPHLGSRIERAEHILVTQLSVTNGSRPIKVRIAGDGSRSYRVRSGSKLSRSYAVDSATWSCECPDHLRRAKPAACKHAMACWILERAYRPALLRASPLGNPPPAEPGEPEHVSTVAGRVLVEAASLVKAREGLPEGTALYTVC